MIAGVITGLIPGIHPNTVIFTSVPFYLSSNTGIDLYTSFITTLSVTHTFCDFLPALFISSPDAESALAVIGGQSAVEQGKGLEMFYYTVFGGLLSLLPVLIISGLSLLYLKNFYSILEALMPYVLLFFLFFRVVGFCAKIPRVLQILCTSSTCWTQALLGYLLLPGFFSGPSFV